MRTASPVDEHELKRDESLVAAQFLRSIAHLLIDALDTLLVDTSRSLDVPELHERMTSIVDTSIQRHSQVQDRWRRRRRATKTPIWLPACVRQFQHNGHYLGSFVSFQAAATHLVASRAVNPSSTGTSERDLRYTATNDASRAVTSSSPSHCDRIDALLDLHLHGYLWTIDAGGQIHVFLPPSSPLLRQNP